MKRKNTLILLAVFLVAALALSACSEQDPVEVTKIVEVTKEVPGPNVEVTRIVEIGEELPISEVPFIDLWSSSAHADAAAEAFVHWDEDDPAEVPVSCAKCHSTPGFMDYLGADGTEFGLVDNASPIGTVVECVACHNSVTPELTSVVFPSGIEVMGLGDESRCMQCHQGRHSTVSVNKSIEDAGLTDEDTVSEDLGFSNIHYFAAAATQFGTAAKGGYEYDGMTYDSRFEHVDGYDTCTSCHDSHTLEVKFEDCQQCHAGLESSEDLQEVRMEGSLVDFDGDGDLDEGIYFEIVGLQELLYGAMQAYASEVSGAGILYDSHAYPYFFIDSDGDGAVTEGEASYDNKFNVWTARLAKAAYNYQVAQKDSGKFAHGGKYIIQLLYDSIASLNEAVSAPVDLSNAHRNDHGHFDGSGEAFRHWDEDAEVSASCSRCHSADGLPLYLEYGVELPQETSNGFKCSTCHDDLVEYTRYLSEEVAFPSGAVLATDDPDSNLCLNCHQGRESTVSLNRTIGDVADDDLDDSLRFRNIHYFAAGASLFGGEAKGAYEYDGAEYVGRNEHVAKFDTCIECHGTHTLEVQIEDCSNCHENVEVTEDLQDIRSTEVDFDGDGDLEEGIYNEVMTLNDALYAAMLDYSSNVAGAGIVYESHSYPYFFTDLNGNGVADPDEAVRANGYATWTPTLLRAAYNYQYAAKDPGAYAHNPLYIIQVLYDSIDGIGGDTSGMTRP